MLQGSARLYSQYEPVRAALPSHYYLRPASAEVFSIYSIVIRHYASARQGLKMSVVCFLNMDRARAGDAILALTMKKVLAGSHLTHHLYFCCAKGVVSLEARLRQVPSDQALSETVRWPSRFSAKEN